MNEQHIEHLIKSNHHKCFFHLYFLLELLFPFSSLFSICTCHTFSVLIFYVSLQLSFHHHQHQQRNQAEGNLQDDYRHKPVVYQQFFSYCKYENVNNHLAMQSLQHIFVLKFRNFLKTLIIKMYIYIFFVNNA